MSRLIYTFKLINADQKYCRMLQREHSPIFSTFIKQPFVIKPFVWLFYTGFTVHITERDSNLFIIWNFSTYERAVKDFSLAWNV